MSFNVWQPQGTVLTNTAAFAPQQPNVLFEADAQILSGTVLKMWYTSSGGLNYAESLDGLSWTEYSGNPVIAAPFWGTKIFKYGETYYCYADQVSVDTGLTQGAQIAVWTSSNGLTWTLENASAIIPGLSGAWDSFGVAQLGICAVINGIWYGYYTGTNSNAKNYQVGLATSSDGINWTKSINNPVTTFDSGTFIDGSSWTGSGNLTFAQRNGIFYAWSQTTPVAFPGSSSNLPTDITRWSATNPEGPWTALGSLTFYRTLASEGIGNNEGQVADPTLVEVSDRTYMFYTVTSDQTSSTFEINCAIANMTLAELVQTYEGVQGIPIPYSLSLNLNALASDNFHRANANPVGGNWTPVASGLAGFTTSQVISDTLQSSTLDDGSDSVYTGINWPSDQFSQVTVEAINTSPSGILLDLRVTGYNTAAPTFLRTVVRVESGGTNGFIFQTFANGSGTNVQLGTFAPSVGDIYTFCVIGTMMLFYSNESLLFITTEVNISSGDGGTGLVPVSSISNAAISLWTGGGFQNPADIEFSISGNCGVGGAVISHTGAESGSTTADTFGNYNIPNLPNGIYFLTPQALDFAFSPQTQSVILYNENQTEIDFLFGPFVSVRGFSPNWYEGQNNAGLSFYISPGSINGVVYPGSLQTLNIPINPQTGLLNSPVTVYFWLNSNGQIQQGLSLPASGPGLNVYPVAAVNAINVLTGTRPNGFSPQTTQAPGIAAVIDLRPITQTNFEF